MAEQKWLSILMRVPHVHSSSSCGCGGEYLLLLKLLDPKWNHVQNVEEGEGDGA